MPKRVNVKTKHEASNYSIDIRCGGLDGIGAWARTILGSDRKIAVVSNKKVFGLFGQRFSKSLAKAGFAREEGKKKVRLRFVRDDDGTISIQINAASPALPVGVADFG